MVFSYPCNPTILRRKARPGWIAIAVGPEGVCFDALPSAAKQRVICAIVLERQFAAHRRIRCET